MKRRCQECGQDFNIEEGDEDHPVQDKVCYFCFEAGVEEAHFKRLERIARENEY